MSAQSFRLLAGENQKLEIFNAVVLYISEARALAQIRNSKITAKSKVLNKPQTLIAMYQQTPSSEIEVSQPALTMEGLPCFNLKIKSNRPCCLQRKRLSAVAPIFYESNRDPSLVTI
ncbi:hypothetical protein H5410_008120 [Solanum commersonii]|uniref:Uncharacterized protein n=1 Tax=Solanum commersonii TaxID=4109 RepID=A0A9J6AE06_SOLCO|nr:hypothetical protein H5410_008120 [Solanum commersonii]